MLTVPAARAVTTSGDRVARGPVATVTLGRAAGPVVAPVTRHVTLVAAEARTTQAPPGRRVADGVAAALTRTGATGAVAAGGARCNTRHGQARTSLLRSVVDLLPSVL